jgi:predicted RNA-binding Zn ribbon-like protein
METKPGRRQPPLFDLMGNVCLDFINTLDNRPSGKPKELLKSYYELARFGEDTGILTPQELDFFYERVHLIPDEAQEAMRRARNLREALYDIFSAVLNKKPAPQLALDRLNTNLHDAALHSWLVQPKIAEPKIAEPKIVEPKIVEGKLPPDDGRLQWRFEPMTASLGAMLRPIARAAADLLASSDLALVRTCASPTCQWFFLDTSKNHHRRWCSMKQCGNRAKVRSFYAKKKAGHTPSGF